MKAVMCTETLLSIEQHVSSPTLFAHVCRALRLLEDLKPAEVAALCKSDRDARQKALGASDSMSDVSTVPALYHICPRHAVLVPPHPHPHV
jgi:hypothetical protein